MKFYFACLVLFVSFKLLGQETTVSSQTGIESEIAIAINPNNEDEIIISSMSGSGNLVFSSIDGGVSWNESSFTMGAADPILAYGDNDTAYLSYLDFGNTLEVSLATSTDNGQSWDAEILTLDGNAVDRPWIKRDNTPSSPFYRNLYLAYFHPEDGLDIHMVKVDPTGVVGTNQSVQSNTYDFVQNPAMDISRDGTVVVCFLSQHEDDSFKIMAVHSTDGSDSFSNESIVTDVNMYLSNGNPVTDVFGFASGASSRLGNSLQMAIDTSNGPFTGRVYLSWTDFVQNDPAEGMNIYLSYSDDNGVTWSPPAIVNDDSVPSSHQYYAAIDVNPNGILCLSWYDRREDPTNDALTDFYFTLSEDGGQTFSNSIKVNAVSSDHTAVTTGATTFSVGEYVTLASSDSFAYVTWADGRTNNGDMDVYFAKVDLANLLNVSEIILEPTVLVGIIWPNPNATNELNVTLNLSAPTEVEFTIKNIQGMVLSTIEKQEYSATNLTVKVPISNFSSGVYILETIHSKGRVTRKFVIE